MKRVSLAPDRSVIDEVAEAAPHLVPVAASVMPFSDLFTIEGVGEDDDGEECFSIRSELPFPDGEGEGRSWSAGLYPDRVTVLHLHDGSRITGRDTMSLREFWQALRKMGIKAASKPKEGDRR